VGFDAIDEKGVVETKVMEINTRHHLSKYT
jgi:hypothetical protein